MNTEIIFDLQKINEQADELKKVSIYSFICAPDEFNNVAGETPYRLLAYISMLFSGETIIDIGTHYGSASLALSVGNNFVYSFDTENRTSQQVKEYAKSTKKIEYIHEDLWNEKIREKWKTTLSNSAIIFLHMRPQQGYLEYEFYKYLLDIHYDGLLICDNIWYYKGMRDNFWYQIPPDMKMDITLYGSKNGTGLIQPYPNRFNFTFSGSHLIQNINYTTTYKEWTFISYCFHDESVENIHTTMLLPYPLVLYCNNKTYEILQQVRPQYLQHMTIYKVHDYDHDHDHDHDHEHEYKNLYDYIQEAVDENPFHSEYFAYIDICIEKHIPNRTLFYVQDIPNIKRDEISVCFLEYIPEYITIPENWIEYYRIERIPVSHLFFTANKHYMKQLCIAMKKLYIETKEAMKMEIKMETLYPILYYRHPTWFHPFYHSIANYTYISVDIGTIIEKYIKNCFEWKKYDICASICEDICISYQKNKTQIDFCPNTVLFHKFLYYYWISTLECENSDVQKVYSWIKTLPLQIEWKQLH